MFNCIGFSTSSPAGRVCPNLMKAKTKTVRFNKALQRLLVEKLLHAEVRWTDLQFAFYKLAQKMETGGIPNKSAVK